MRARRAGSAKVRDDARHKVVFGAGAFLVVDGSTGPAPRPPEVEGNADHSRLHRVGSRGNRSARQLEERARE